MQTLGMLLKEKKLSTIALVVPTMVVVVAFRAKCFCLPTAPRRAPKQRLHALPSQPLRPLAAPLSLTRR